MPISNIIRPGKHFLQIPGPTNVPDRILRAMDYPTIDHRGPDFAELGLSCLLYTSPSPRDVEESRMPSSA